MSASTMAVAVAEDSSAVTMVSSSALVSDFTTAEGLLTDVARHVILHGEGDIKRSRERRFRVFKEPPGFRPAPRVYLSDISDSSLELKRHHMTW